VHRFRGSTYQLTVIANGFHIPFHDERALLLFKPEFPISTSSLRKTIGLPPTCVNLRSPWPRLGGKRGLFRRSPDWVGLFPSSNLAGR
jgi:hypothetical protein